MRAEDHQNQWFNFGVVLFGGGVVVSADWVFAVQSAPHANRLSYTQWPIILWAVMVGGGVYVMLASYIENWPLPGKKRVRAAKDRRSFAIGYLNLFHLIGTQDIPRSETTDKEVAEWSVRLVEYVQAAWGSIEATALLAQIETPATRESIPIINARVDELMKRTVIMTVQDDFDATKSAKWISFVKRRIEGFSTEKGFPITL